MKQEIVISLSRILLPKIDSTFINSTFIRSVNYCTENLSLFLHMGRAIKNSHYCTKKSEQRSGESPPVELLSCRPPHQTCSHGALHTGVLVRWSTFYAVSWLSTFAPSRLPYFKNVKVKIYVLGCVHLLYLMVI